MTREDSPPGQSSPPTAGASNAVSYQLDSELRESSPQFWHHKVRTRNRVNQKVGLPQSGLANHTDDIRNPTSMLSERLVAGRK